MVCLTKYTYNEESVTEVDEQKQPKKKVFIKNSTEEERLFREFRKLSLLLGHRDETKNFWHRANIYLPQLLQPQGQEKRQRRQRHDFSRDF